MEQTDNRKVSISGLTFHDLSDKTRGALAKGGKRTAGDLTRLSDRELAEMGVTKKDTAVIDRILKSLGLSRILKGSQAVAKRPALRVYGMDSLITFSSFRDVTVRNIVEAQRHRALRHLYYTAENVDFTPEVAQAIKLKYLIEKPGVCPELEKILNDQLDNNIHGMLKLKLKSYISKTMRKEDEAKRHSGDRFLTRAQMQAANLGRFSIDTSLPGDDASDRRQYADWIKERGYGISRPKAKPKTPLKSLYVMVRKGAEKTLVLQGEEYMANLTFLELVEATRPEDFDEALGLIFDAFEAKEYFSMIDSLGLSRSAVQILLTRRSKTIVNNIVTNPYTGNSVWLMDITLENNANEKGFPRPTFLNERTWDRRDPEAFFAEAEAFAPASPAGIPSEGVAMTLDRLVDCLKTFVGKDGTVSTLARQDGPGRRPLTYDMKMKNGELYIRKNDGKRDMLFSEAHVFFLENTGLITKMVEQIKNYGVERH